MNNKKLIVMNDNRLFLSKKDALVELLNAGMPKSLITTYFGISSPTYHNYVRVLKHDYEWKGETTLFLKGIPNMFKILRNISFSYSPDLHFRKCINIINLKRALIKTLEVERIIEILEISAKSIQKMGYYSFSEEVPEGYRNFINYLNFFEESRETVIYPRQLFDDFIKNIKDVEIKIGDTTKTWFYPIVDLLLQKVTSSIRNWVKPTFKVEVCEKVDFLLETLTAREAMIIRMYYGLGEPKFGLDEIGTRHDLTRERVRQIKEKALGRCRDVSRTKILFDQLPTKKSYDEPMIILCKTKISDCNFSIRATNVLNAIDIEFLEELTIFSQNDLLRFRSMGKKSIAEVQVILQSHGLSLKKE